MKDLCTQQLLCTRASAVVKVLLQLLTTQTLMPRPMLLLLLLAPPLLIASSGVGDSSDGGSTAGSLKPRVSGVNQGKLAAGTAALQTAADGLAVAPGCVPVARPAPSRRVRPATGSQPHLVTLMIDDLGFDDLRPHDVGSGVTTFAPTVAELLKDGVLLDRHHAYKWCSPSRRRFLKVVV